VKVKTHKHQARKPWLTQGLIKSIRVKNKLCKKFLRTRSTDTETKYKTFRNKLNHLLKVTKKRFYTNKLDYVKGSIKETWKTLKELLNKSKTKHNYPDSFVHNNIHISNNESIANNFNDYFVNGGSNLASKIPATHTNFSTY
jgi:ElaB/YqjD/DUF883 family membrane-anchored ribosome-binding protein